VETALSRYELNKSLEHGSLLHPLTGFAYQYLVQHYQTVLQDPRPSTLLELLDPEIVEGFPVAEAVKEPVDSGLAVATDEHLEGLVISGSCVGSLDGSGAHGGLHV